MNTLVPSLRRALLATAFALAAAIAARAAEPAVSVHEYTIGESAYEGILVRPLPRMATYPAVLVVHDWLGNGDFSREKAIYLGKLGYIAFAVDMYGKGIRADNATDAAKLAGKLYQEPALFRQRILAALTELKAQSGVDPERIAAIGFCFGGTTVLELARSGADVTGVASFHGGLKPFTPTAPGTVKARMLILHGVRDPLVPPADLAAALADFNAAGARIDLVAYADAVHSFTNPRAGNDPTKSAAYQARADRESFAALEKFLAELFAK